MIMFHKKPTIKQIIGKKGEELACQYLESRGFKVITRNYSRKWGELDIVVEKDKILHFIEVKTVSREISDLDVIRETDYRPEDNMHPWKLRCLSRIIQTYLMDEREDDPDWHFDVVTVYIDEVKGRSKVFLIEDVTL